jgi:Leucine-rich repeat (LRR) protein
MSAAEDAYQAAEAAIEEAKRTGAEELNFDVQAFRALETIPPGIGALDGLRTLELNHTQVGDLAPLRELTGLQTLRLDSTQVSDLVPLQGLTGLQALSLRRTQVSDLVPLQGLTELQALMLDSTQVSELAPLQGLTGLQTLVLNSLRVSNLAPLAGLTALRFLSLNYTLVSEVAPLAGVMSIDAVESFDDIHSLEGLQKLTALELSHTSIRDISPIGYLKRLSSLLLDGTPVSDLEPLRELTQLQRLRLDSTQVNDIGPLRGLTNLHTLSLSKTRVNELAPLRDLTRMNSLSLSGTLVSDLEPLQNLRELRGLFLDNTLVSDLAPLQGLTGLQTLALNTTRVSDLAPLQGLTGLQTLALNTTRASDLTPLRRLRKLQTLSLITTQVSDLDPLRGLTGLRNLSLDNTQVLDLRPLQRLGRLADEPNGGGLSFPGIPAARDPKIAEIAAIEDAAARAIALFALLDAGWVPPVLNHQTMMPEQVSAPIEAEVNAQGVLVERPVSPSLTGEQDARARAGWVALRELQIDAIDTLCKDNLPSLRRAIHAFGRALGEDYGTMNVIALGTHGRRIIEMSKTVDEALLEDAAGDLVAFAAAIHLHLQRFPEWIAYLRDTEEAAPEGPPVAVSGPQLRVILAVLTGAEDVDPALARKFGDLVEGAEEAETVDAAAKLGVLRSLSNILVPLARQVLAGARRLGGDLLGETYKKGIAGTVLAGMGVGSDLIFNKGQVLLALARDYPKTLGWLTQVLRALGIS